MSTLERRVTELERTTRKQEFNIFIGFDEPRAEAKEVTFLTDRKGGEWAKMQGESEEDFKARAAAETPRSSFGLAMLFDCH